VQPLEGDRILTPAGDGDWQPVTTADGRTLSQWIHGVQVDGAGRPLNYTVCRRGSGINQFLLDRIVPAANVYHHAHFERFDQVRGVSPLAATLNTLRDVYEGFDFALAKMKVSQLFGLSIYRQNLEGFPDYVAQEEGEAAGYQVDFGQGPFLLNLDPGDKAEFLESKSPSTEFQSFSQVMIQVALKALDIPYSFWAENYTNYSGARGAYLQYEQSAEVKRCDVRRMLDWWTTWQIQLAIQDGELPGVTPDQISWEWVHRGMPWLDPLKEIQAEKEAVDLGADNPEDIAQRHGRNFFDNIDKTAACRAYAASKGVPFMTQVKEDNAKQTNSKTPVGEDTTGEGDQDQQGQGD
jgi:capsid protein